jgi:hypothetical protein
MTPRTEARGSCLCGGVSFTAGLPSKWAAHCHCTRCQRAHGAAFVTWVSVDEARVELRDPANLLRWHVAEAGGSRGFCSKCGSPMFFKAAPWPGELHIARALFIDPVDREPQVHAYYDTHVSWVTPADDLPRKPAPSSPA